MAGLKKKKKEKSSSPNVVLVVFLVLFVLTSIGLGVWGYYGYAGQAALANAKNQAQNTAKTEKTTAQFYAMAFRDLKLAVFGPEAIDGDEKIELEGNRTAFNQQDFGPFKNEKGKESVKKMMDELKLKLGVAANNQDYDKNYKKELEDAVDKIKQIQGTTAAEVASHEKTKALLATLTKERDKFYQEVRDRIAKDNANALAQVNAKSDAFKKISENNIELNEKIKDLGDQLSKKDEEHDKVIKGYVRQLKILEAERKENLANGVGPGGAPVAGGGPKGDLFPLLLDISPGKPLWDQPVGKVISVDLGLRQVTINLGSVHGVHPELTFNIFGPNAAGRAEKQMKGTIEVIKVDLNSSTCRITSMYDQEGVEMLMNLQASKRAMREADMPIREGDLLFNLFWGTRVAVAGYVSITGEEVSNPAEQFRQMDDFMALCRRNGMLVDAYVDVRTGALQGKITQKTRYLILGAKLARPGEKKADAPIMKKEDDDKEKDGEKEKAMEKEPMKDEGGIADRIDAVNRSSQALWTEARDKGLLLISAENFANVIGYRKARSANSIELSRFRPQLPYAGAPGTGVLVLPDRPREPMPMDMDKEKKKEPDNN
ncbi:MAG TPA: hypothetical protein VFE62_04310 [Gemmataceae bacterium]|nr:hypothetical protein [Gemmataceae bacterium]